jgi:hypothetical protein
MMTDSMARVRPCPKADILMGPPGLLFGSTLAIFVLASLIAFFL